MRNPLRVVLVALVTLIDLLAIYVSQVGDRLALALNIPVVSIASAAAAICWIADKQMRPASTDPDLREAITGNWMRRSWWG